MKFSFKKKAQMCIASALAVLVTLGGSAQMFSTAAETKADENAAEITVDIYPKPQSLQYTEPKTGMQFDGSVELVFNGEQDSATEAKVKQLLADNGISYTEAD